MIIIISLSLYGCGNEAKIIKTKQHFDLDSFFTSEAMLLQKKHQKVLKTVSQNDKMETKEQVIANWAEELELFSASDINKPAWRDSYRIVQKDTVLEYSALDEDLRTRTLQIITSPSGKVKKISVFNRTKNVLYTSTEDLQYLPDSLYVIKKHQKVLLIGANSYYITSKL